MRRDRAQVMRDRARILDHVGSANSVWVRVPSWARANDVAALVREGWLVREVRREWDGQTGYAANLFGGAGVMQRHRAYIARPESVEALKRQIAEDTERRASERSHS